MPIPCHPHPHPHPRPRRPGRQTGRWWFVLRGWWNHSRRGARCRRLSARVRRRRRAGCRFVVRGWWRRRCSSPVVRRPHRHACLRHWASRCPHRRPAGRREGRRRRAARRPSAKGPGAAGPGGWRRASPGACGWRPSCRYFSTHSTARSPTGKVSGPPFGRALRQQAGRPTHHSPPEPAPRGRTTRSERFRPAGRASPGPIRVRRRPDRPASPRGGEAPGRPARNGPRTRHAVRPGQPQRVGIVPWRPPHSLRPHAGASGASVMRHRERVSWPFGLRRRGGRGRAPAKGPARRAGRTASASDYRGPLP